MKKFIVYTIGNPNGDLTYSVSAENGRIAEKIVTEYIKQNPVICGFSLEQLDYDLKNTSINHYRPKRNEPAAYVIIPDEQAQIILNNLKS